MQQVARERNYARIRELANVPALLAWLEANGLSVDEAAMIQPEYCGTPANNCVCGDAFASGLIQGTLGDGGASLVVVAVYGPVPGVKVGDEVPFVDSANVAGPTDIVFASWSGNGNAYPKFVAPGQSPDGGAPSVVVPESVCWFPQVAVIPGPLPIDIVTQALSAPTAAACEQVLAQYDAQWGEMQGGPECFSGTGGSGGVGGTGGSGGAGGTSGIGAAGGASGGGPADAGSHAVDSSDSSGGCSVAHLGALGGEAALAISRSVDPQRRASPVASALSIDRSRSFTAFANASPRAPAGAPRACSPDRSRRRAPARSFREARWLR